MGIVNHRYPNEYDRPSIEQWIRNAVLPNPILWYPVRSNDALLFAMLHIPLWTPNAIDANIVVMLADRGAIWQLPTLLKSSIEWAKSRHATKWRCESGILHDIGPLMRRIGARPNPSYELELA